jgi:adenine-specific DNA-methyltransferase
MTELIWDGKYKDGKKQGPVRIALPFQTIETVNESVQERQKSLELFSAGRETQWRNRLVWGDKKYVLPSLLPEFQDKVNLIYIDPPFDTGADFSFTATIPTYNDANSDDDDAVMFVKEPSVLEQKAYRDTWGKGLDSYLRWLHETFVLLHELLAPTGCLYVHLGANVSHYAKVLLDDIFGYQNFVNEIVWKRQASKSGAFEGLGQYGRIHEVILFYAKTDSWTWNQQYTAYDEEYVSGFYRFTEERTGRRYQLDNLTASGSRRGESGGPVNINGEKVYLPPGRHWSLGLKPGESVQQAMDRLVKVGRIWHEPGRMPRYKRYLDEMPGVMLQDVWTDVRPVPAQGSERLNYETQKAEALLERILLSSSNENDLVLDCFVGSGTTAAVAEKLNRRWLVCDLGRFAVHTTRKRLLTIPNVRPFTVQNLGKYERQAWQVAEFPANGKDHLEEQRQREAAYRQFILDLYHANAMSGYGWLHGVKSGRMVHVGAVDAPVTPADVKAIAKEAWKALGTGKDGPTKAAVDILGWEFAFELNEPAKQLALESRVDVNFKKIPREVLDKKAVEQGDVRFFELGALAVDAKQKGCEVALQLKNFLIPTDDIPGEARKAIKHWSQLIDYWAVDWDYKNDTFHNQWQAYRTRKDPKIELETKYRYAQSGKYAGYQRMKEKPSLFGPVPTTGGKVEGGLRHFLMSDHHIRAKQKDN